MSELTEDLVTWRFKPRQLPAEVDQLRAKVAELERQADIGRRAVSALKEIVAEGQEFEARTGKAVKSEWFPRSIAILRDAEQAGMGVGL